MTNEQLLSPEEVDAGRKQRKLPSPKFPNADDIVAAGIAESNSTDKVDILLVNPPAPDGGIWIRSQHRVGRRSRENMVWPQVSLAQMAALLHPVYKVKVVDAIGERLTWPQFKKLLEKHSPKYYLTQVTAPTLENDMYGTFLAKNRGARTIAFGTHVTPIPRETLRTYATLDFVLCGEPDLTLRDLLDHLEKKSDERSESVRKLFAKHDPTYVPPAGDASEADLSRIKGLVWRRGADIVMNVTRPFVADLDDMPIPMHELLPLNTYRMPMLNGPFTFIVPSRGCPAACTYCIKHVTYQYSVRARSAQNVMQELWKLKKLGLNNIHMYADLFTVDRTQVVSLCERMISENIGLKWTCNSRVDFVDEELLRLMAKAGCHLIAWGIESGNEAILKHARKGANPAKAKQSLTWSRKAGIKNWGYFIIGLPGETEATIRDTIDFSKGLPLDIALFHIAAPYPGTPFFFEVMKNGWFRKGTRWEQVDMDKETVLDYPDLPGDRLEYWQKRAFREWAFRPGPMFTFMKMLFTDVSMLKNAMNVAGQHTSWLLGGQREEQHAH
jgi:anaerobic magnesium-protoporphyrin IX monomethyl ester cyclase